MQEGAHAHERLIKRYDNRKLYDPASKTYVTLQELAGLVASGHEVKVLDQKSGDDITNTVLAQVILDALKERTLSIPRQVLVRLIRIGMTPSASAEPPAPRVDPLARARDDAERIVARLLQRGRLPLEEALALRQEIAGSLRGLARDVERRVETRLGGVLRWAEKQRGLAPSLETLKAKLFALEASLEAAPRRRKKTNTRRRSRK